MKKNADSLDRTRKRSVETLDNVEEVIMRVRSMNPNMFGPKGGAGSSGGGGQRTLVLPHDVEIRKEMNKLLGVRDRLRTKMPDLKEQSDKDAFAEMNKRLDKLLEQLRIMEKLTKSKGGGGGGGGGAAGNSGSDNAGQQTMNKTLTQHWVKDAIGNLKQRIAALESEVGKGKGGGGGAGANAGRKSAVISNPNNKLTPSETLGRYQNQHAKLEQLLQSVQNDELRPEEVDTVRGEVRELLKDKVDSDTLSKVEWYDRLFGPLAKAKQLNAGNKAAAGRHGMEAGSKAGAGGGQLPLPRSSSRKGNTGGGPGDLLLDDGAPPAWADDTAADANNDDTFGGDITGPVRPAVGSLAELMQRTQLMMRAPEEERKRRLAQKAQQQQQEEQEEQRRTRQETAAAAAAPAAAPTTTGTATATATGTPAAAAAPAKRADFLDLDEETAARMLEMSLLNLSHPLDADRHRVFQPPNEVEPMDSFPSEIHPVLSHRHIYHKFDDSSLFFIFYYHQKDYQHLYAASVLRKRGYFFRKVDTMWYQIVTKPAHPPVAASTTSPTAGQPEAGPAPAAEVQQCLQYFDFQGEWRWKESPLTEISPLEFEM
eukprot:gene9283-6525_t